MCSIILEFITYSHVHAFNGASFFSRSCHSTSLWILLHPIKYDQMGFVLMRPHRILESMYSVLHTLAVITITNDGYDGLMQTWLRCFKVKITYTLIKFSSSNSVHIQIECEKEYRSSRRNRFESTVQWNGSRLSAISSFYFSSVPKWIYVSLWAKKLLSCKCSTVFAVLRLHHHYHQKWCKTLWCAAHHELDQLVSLSFRKMGEGKNAHNSV